MRIREVKDSFEASVLRAVSVGGIVGGSWAGFEGFSEGGGVPGRRSVKGGMIRARRGEEKSCSWGSALLEVSIVLAVLSSRAAGIAWLISLFAWCMIVSVERFVVLSGEAVTVM